MDRFVKRVVKSGAFNNASEVHRAALTALAREEEERELRLARLRQEIQAGLDSGRPAVIEDPNSFLEDCAAEVMNESKGHSKR
ncbi:MAG: type II toxin-antitoxin system ParD family antitoxin [Opitutaceae bacterium]|nr:type II toxin-antitoxin system ParD family antitoxin [Opitutaceae bacterium]